MDGITTSFIVNQDLRLDDKRLHMVARLRDLADEIERLRVRPDLKTTRPDYVRQGQRVAHLITWGIANMGIDGYQADCAELQLIIERAAWEDKHGV